MENEGDIPEMPMVSDPLDELLQQVSELTLRTNHIDAALKEIERSVADGGEVTHAGLVEIRGLLAQRHGDVSDPIASAAVTERLESLELTAARTARHQLILVVLLIASLALGALELVMMTGAAGTKKKVEDVAFVPPAPPPPGAMPSLAPAPPAAPMVTGPVPSLDPVKNPGRDPKHRNRH